MVDAARLVVVLEENRVPAVLCRRGLACRQRFLERRQRPGLCVTPDFYATGELQVHVAELEQHREHALVADPFVEVFRRNAVRLADREDVMAVKDIFLELMEIIEDARRIRRHRVDVDHAVVAVRLAIDKRRLLDVDNRVNAEAADALVEPEVRGVVERLAHIGVRPVEVWLLRSERMQVVLLPLLAPRPGRTAEDRAPVRRRRAVGLRVAPDVPVSLRVRAVFFRLQEPRMLIGRVVEHEVHDDADAALLRFRDQAFHVRHRAIRRVDAFVVGDVIAIVDHRRRIDRRQPDGTCAERLQIVEFCRDAIEVARARSRRVEEAFRVDLIDLAGLPPFQRSVHK